MITVFRLLSIRYLRMRWDRSALIIGCIALGVATLVSTRILNRTIEVAALETTTPVGIGDYFITNGELGVNRQIAEEIRAAKIPGVRSVQPLVIERITLPQQDGRSAVLIGAELAMHQMANSKDPKDIFNGDNELKVNLKPLLENVLWAAMSTRPTVAVSRTIYDEWLARRTKKDEPLLVRFGTRPVEVIPVVVMDIPNDSPVAALGRNVIGMEVTEAARFLRPLSPDQLGALVGAFSTTKAQEALTPVKVNRIDILLEKNADRAASLDKIERIVGNRAEVRTLENQGQNTQEIVNGIQIGFTMCSLGAMIVGLFLVYNALAVTVAERSHDIGILRSIGATRAQVILLFTFSAFVLGVFGSLLGIPLGMGMARFAIEQIREDLATLFMNPDVDPTIPTLGTVLIAFGAGIATALFAGILPAIQAAAQDPANAVRRSPGATGGAWRVAHRAVCAALVAGGVAMILTRDELPPRVGAFGGMAAALIGLLLAMPIFVGIMVQFLQPLLRQWLPLEARLAADNLIRSPGRTGLVIGALAAGVAVMIQTAGVGRSNEEPITRWLDEVIQADVFVSAGSIVDSISSSCPIDSKQVEELNQVPGVDKACGLRYVRPQFNGTVIFLVAMDVNAFVDPSQKRGPAGLPNLDRLRALTREDGVIASENFAIKHNVRAGDRILLTGPRGPISLKILDTAKDYTWSRGTLFMDRSVYARLFEDPHVDICHVFFKDSAEEGRAKTKQAVARHASDRGLIVAERTVLRQYLGELFDRVYKLVHLQQIVVGLVAGLGVITSLLISVIQRKRELALLLAVGATPWQIVGTVLAEALLMGLFGTLLGMFMGIPLEWYVLKIVLFEESGFLFDLVWPWQQALAIAAGSILIAGLAGLLPALKAMKMRIPDAILYE